MSTELTQQTFKDFIASGLALVDFWAPWCGPCRMVSPLVDEIANETTDAKVGKINIDEQLELAQAFGVMSIPTLAVIKDGNIVAYHISHTVFITSCSYTLRFTVCRGVYRNGYARLREMVGT